MTTAFLLAMFVQAGDRGYVPKTIRPFNENECFVCSYEDSDTIAYQLVGNLLSDKRFNLIESEDLGIVMCWVSKASYQAASRRLRHCPELTGSLILPEDGDTVASPGFGRGFEPIQPDEAHRATDWEPIMRFYDQLVSPHFYKLEAPKLVKRIWSQRISYRPSAGQEVVGTNFVTEVDDGSVCTYEWLQSESGGAGLKLISVFSVKPKCLGLPLVNSKH